MSRLKLDQDTLGLSTVLERMTHARVKDCFREGEMIYCIIAPGDVGKAIGKQGSTIKKVQEELGKPIKIIEFNENVIDFVRNVIAPLTVAEIIEENGIIILKDTNKKTKSLLIGRESRNLGVINRAVKRFFNVEVKVV